jgi:hypothetical protein
MRDILSRENARCRWSSVMDQFRADNKQRLIQQWDFINSRARLLALSRPAMHAMARSSHL